MAITQPSKRSKADAFAAGAPDAKPAPKLRGKRQTITFGLPPDLIAEIDAIAAEESRSRARMIEIGMRQFVRDYRRQAGTQEAA
jgi:hypothetical protein